MLPLSKSREEAIKSIARLLSKYEPARVFVPGTLGNAVGVVEVPDRSGYIYVRLLGETERTVRARNVGVPVVADASVWVELMGSPGDRERYRVTPIGNVGRSYTDSIDINSDTIRVRQSKTPASASDTGNAGDICWDANYIYICIASNTWRRIAHSSW